MRVLRHTHLPATLQDPKLVRLVSAVDCPCFMSLTIPHAARHSPQRLIERGTEENLAVFAVRRPGRYRGVYPGYDTPERRHR